MSLDTGNFDKEKVWGGLNRPGISQDAADITVFGIPFDEGTSFRSGASEAPLAIRKTTYSMPPTTSLFEDISRLRVLDLGDFTEKNRDVLFDQVEKKTCELVRNKKFFTMIGGDHSTTIPVLSGIDRALAEPFGIIHIDAHFDLCDELAGDRLSHGCTERRAVELKNVGNSSNIFFLGIRSPELDEINFIHNNPVNIIDMNMFDILGLSRVVEEVIRKMEHLNHIYLTIDIDCLDPAVSAGTGTPCLGGFNSRELMNLIRGLFSLPIIGFDVVEVAPSLDPSLASVFAGRRIITECWGNHIRGK